MYGRLTRKQVLASLLRRTAKGPCNSAKEPSHAGYAGKFQRQE